MLGIKSMLTLSKTNTVSSALSIWASLPSLQATFLKKTSEKTLLIPSFYIYAII